MQLGTLVASALGNMLASKPKVTRWGVIKTGKRVIELV